MIRAFDPDPSLTWLFCFAHPDDEVAVGAWIRRLTSQGNTVWLTWMHDTPVRRREALQAARLLGVTAERCVFLGAADGAVMDEAERLIPRLSNLVRQIQPDRVCTLAFEQGHLDHDSTNLFVNLVFEGIVLEFPMYHTYTVALQKLNEFADPTDEDTIDLTLDERRFKNRLLRQYPSQTIRRNVVLYGVWRRLILRPVYLDRVERLRVQTHRDFLSPNLPPDLARRVRQSRNWERWESTIRPMLDQAAMDRLKKWHGLGESE